MSQWDYGMPPPPEHHDPYAGEDTFRSDDFDGTSGYPITWEREPAEPPTRWDREAAEPLAPWDREPAEPPTRWDRGSAEPPTRWDREPAEPPTQRLGLERGPAGADWLGGDWRDDDWPPRHRRRGRGRGGHGSRGGGGGRGVRPRWLVGALVVVGGASVGAALVLTGGHSGGQATATRSPAPPRAMPPAPAAPAAGQGALTMAQATQVLAGYTSANNAANAQRSDTVLATIETGSSYAVDAGIYRTQQAENEAPYPAFGPQRAQYYIPRETAYPRWFVVQVANANLASPGKITGAEYLLFTQAAPGAAWKNTVEPYVVTGAATPAVALGADGLATPVTTAMPLAVPMGQIAQVTAASLDGMGALPNPGNLADLMDKAFWQRKLPTSAVTDAHTPSGNGVFGLRTSDGGALLFYTDAAQLTLTAPAGEVMHLTVPGFYSPSQSLSKAGIGYLEQFATYDPPSGGSGLRVVADYSGITSGS